jgi:hypothetical protein
MYYLQFTIYNLQFTIYNLPWQVHSSAREETEWMLAEGEPPPTNANDGHHGCVRRHTLGETVLGRFKLGGSVFLPVLLLNGALPILN